MASDRMGSVLAAMVVGAGVGVSVGFALSARRGHSHSRDGGARLDEAPAEAPRTPSWWSSPAPTPSSSVATPTPGARAAATSRLSPEHRKPEGSLQEVLATKEKQIEELTTRLGALRDALTEQAAGEGEKSVSSRIALLEGDNSWLRIQVEELAAQKGQGGAGASVDFDESSDAMVTVLMAQVSSLMREKKALVAEINTLARDNQALEERVKYLARGSVYYDSTDSPAPGGSPSYD